MKTISTIGYEGAQIDAFVFTLAAAKIDLVVDIREVASSRRAGFSKTALKSHLELAGIEYVHFRSLGDPKAGREAMRRGDVREFESVYRARLETPEAQEALSETAHLASQKCIALLCYERDPKHCHRTIVAKAIEADGAFKVRHLGVQSERRIAAVEADDLGNSRIR